MISTFLPVTQITSLYHLIPFPPSCRRTWTASVAFPLFPRSSQPLPLTRPESLSVRGRGFGSVCILLFLSHSMLQKRLAWFLYSCCFKPLCATQMLEILTSSPPPPHQFIADSCAVNDCDAEVSKLLLSMVCSRVEEGKPDPYSPARLALRGQVTDKLKPEVRIPGEGGGRNFVLCWYLFVLIWRSCSGIWDCSSAKNNVTEKRKWGGELYANHVGMGNN